VAIFPGGTVSTSAKPFGPPFDPVWRTFTAKLIAKSGATVVPVYFNGANSRLFQLASHVHLTLRVGLLMREFRRLIRKPVRLTIGDPIDRCELVERGCDPKAMMDFLRQSTYELSQRHCGQVPYGYEFDEKYRRAQHGGRNF
jgi:putative hemolysin